MLRCCSLKGHDLASIGGFPWVATSRRALREDGGKQDPESGAERVDQRVGELETVRVAEDFDRFLRAAALRSGQLLSLSELARGKPANLPQDRPVVFHCASGNRTKVKVVKNKVAPPFREAEFDIMYGEGISREGDLLDLAVDKRIVDKSGAWFAFSGERLGQGRENAKQFLRDNPTVRQTLEDRVRKELGLSREVEAAAV